MPANSEYPFTPLTTIQGLSLAELRALIQKRPIYIWGASFLGLCLKRQFERNGFNVKAFFDINPNLNAIDNLEILRPAVHIQNVKKEGAFVICTVINQNKTIERQCLEAGLEKNKDFLMYMRIPRQQPVIEAGGGCNYLCTVCTKQNKFGGKLKFPYGSDISDKNYMSVALYKKILDKLIAECPLILSIDLSLWREPLLNPDIAEIVRITNNYVPCRIITNLKNGTWLEDLVKAGPAQIQIIAGGYENTYEQNQTGTDVCDWHTFYINIHKLKEYKEKYHAGTDIILLYILYKNNSKPDFDKMKELCAELGFKIVADTGYLTPYDNFLDLCEGRELAGQIQKTKDLLTWNIKNILDMCVKNADNPCICQRIFPIINYDTSVSLCHLFCKPTLPVSFFDAPYAKIVETRHENEFCKRCQRHGLHRLDLEILKKYFSKDDMGL